MRVYLPATVGGLRRVVETGVVPVLSGVGFAVTEPLRGEYPGWSEEDLEYLAMRDAARAALRLLAAAGPAEPPLRVVISVDVPDAAGTARPELDRAVVAIADPVGWPQVAAVHVDGADAGGAVARAAAAVDAADLGDDDAEFAVSEAEEVELAWYGPGEVRYLIEDLILRERDGSG